MQSILKKNPEYKWGWQQLGEWYRESNEVEKYLAVAETLVRLDPHDCMNQAVLGNARVLNEDLEGGKAAYSRAFELMPGHPFPGFRLFDLQLQTEDYAAAASTLIQLGPDIDDALALALQVRWDAANMNQPETFEGLGALLARVDADEEELWKAADAAYERWPMAVVRLLDESLERPETHPLAGELWIRIVAKDEHWRACRKRLEAMDPDREITHRATIAFLECLGQPGRRRQLRRFVRRHRGLLVFDVKVWGMTMWALIQQKDWRAAVRWGGDWREARGLEPWMLFNLAFGHQSLGQFEQAYQIHLRAQTLPPDGTSPRHALWLAVEEAIRGEAGVAENWLSQAQGHLDEAQDSFLAKLARVVLTAADERAREEAGGDAAIRGLLRKVRAELPSYGDEPAFRLAYTRAIRCIDRRPLTRRWLGTFPRSGDDGWQR